MKNLDNNSTPENTENEDIQTVKNITMTEVMIEENDNKIVPFEGKSYNPEKQTNPVNLLPKSFKKLSMERVKVTDLKPNPLKRKIYTNTNVDDLMFNVIENGGVINTPFLVTPTLDIIDGEKRYLVCLLLKIEYVDVIICEVDESLMDLVMVSSNISRQKTGEEIYNEIQVLNKYYGKQQGFRSDLFQIFGENGYEKIDTESRICKTLNISKGVKYQLEQIYKYNPKYLTEIDNIKVKPNTIFSRVKLERKEQEEQKLLEKLTNKEFEFNPTIYHTSPNGMMKFVSKNSVDGIISSLPPYIGTSFGNNGNIEIGLEDTVEEYITNLCPVFENCYRVLKNTGSFFLIVRDSRDEQGYEMNIPHTVLDSLKKIGFKCVQTIIWEMTNPPKIGNDDIYRPSFEYIFHLTKSTDFKSKGWSKSQKGNVIDGQKKEFDESLLEYNGKMWDECWITGDIVRTTVPPTRIDDEELGIMNFPNPLIEIIPIPLIRDYTDIGDTILDPFTGIGTVGVVSVSEKRNFIGFETNETLCRISKERVNKKMKEMNIHRSSSKKRKPEDWFESEFIEV